MQYELAKCLVENNILVAGSEIESSSGKNFIIKDVVITTDMVKAIAKEIMTGALKLITYKDIVMIDGMAPERLANAHDFKADGSKKDLGKKRGRKPKNYYLQIAN